MCSPAFLLLAAVIASPLPSPAQAPAEGAMPQAELQELQAKLAAQRKQLEELEAQVRAGGVRPADAPTVEPKPLDDAAVQKIVEGYLKEHPGAGVPAGVQTGYVSGLGFAIRSAPDPKWSNWDDGSKIPFELRIHGRIQAVYEFYQPTDNLNHLTQTLANGGAKSSPTFSQLEIKRGRLFFDGTAFDPNLRYRIDLEGNRAA